MSVQEVINWLINDYYFHCNNDSDSRYKLSVQQSIFLFKHISRLIDKCENKEISQEEFYNSVKKIFNKEDDDFERT